MAQVRQVKVRRFLSKKIQQLSDIIADLDGLVKKMGVEFYRVAIFGSARIKQDSPEFKQVYDLAYALSARGVDIVTGGGPGLMEAANMGAKAGCKNSRSIGVPIELPFESDPNNHLDVKYHHRLFSSRLDEFMRISHAVVVTPGGIGTLLEMLYTWQLIQVGHIDKRPIILLGSQFWQGLLDWLKQVPLKKNLISKSDFETFSVVDNIDDIITIVDPHIKRFWEDRKAIEEVEQNQLDLPE